MRDRDVYVPKTPPAGVPQQIEPEVSEVYAADPEALKAARAKRSTGERLERLETKYDALVHKVIDSRTKIIVALAGAIGAIGGYLLGGCV